MKFYSDVTKQFYDTEKACLEAEFKVKEKQNREKILREKAERERKEKQEALAAERKARATEVEDARKAMVTAQHKYSEVLEAFCKDYGTFHQTLTDEDAKSIIPTLFDIFNPLFFDFK
jgi:hypothetical protein